MDYCASESSECVHTESALQSHINVRKLILFNISKLLTQSKVLTQSKILIIVSESCVVSDGQLYLGNNVQFRRWNNSIVLSCEEHRTTAVCDLLNKGKKCLILRGHRFYNATQNHDTRKDPANPPPKVFLTQRV